MSRLIPVESVGGIEVYVEVPERMEPAVQDVGTLDRVEHGLQQALDFVASFSRTAAERLNSTLTALAPNEISLEFGIVVGAEAGVVLTAGSVEGQLTVTMTWKKPEAQP